MVCPHCQAHLLNVTSALDADQTFIHGLLDDANPLRLPCNVKELHLPHAGSPRDPYVILADG